MPDKVYYFKASIYYDGGSTFWPFSRPYSMQLFEGTGEREGKIYYNSFPSRLFENITRWAYDTKSHSYKAAVKSAKYWGVRVIKRKLKEGNKRDKTERFTVEFTVEVKDNKVKIK